MNLVPCKIAELGRDPKANLYRLIKAFANSDAECALVEGADKHYARINSGVRAMNAAVKRYGVPGIRATNVNGQIYLIKEYEK